MVGEGMETKQWGFKQVIWRIDLALFQAHVDLKSSTWLSRVNCVLSSWSFNLNLADCTVFVYISLCRSFDISNRPELGGGTEQQSWTSLGNSRGAATPQGTPHIWQNSMYAPLHTYGKWFICLILDCSSRMLLLKNKIFLIVLVVWVTVYMCK